MCFAHVSPVRHALTSCGLSVVNAPFRECVAFPLRSKRFRAEDRGFLSEAGQFPFGKPLSGVARPRLCFCVLVSTVRRFCQFFCWLFCCSRFHFFFLVGFRVCPIFIGTCHFRFRAWCVYILRPWDACLGRARACPRRHSRTGASPVLDQAEAWGSQWAVLQVNEERYYALVHWCHFVQLRRGTIRDVHLHQVLAYPQEEGSCSVHPWGSVLPRGEGRVDAAVHWGASGARLHEVRC